jgi:hypothetical protein
MREAPDHALETDGKKPAAATDTAMSGPAEKPHEHYVAGQIPPVAEGGHEAGAHDRTASQLAFEDDDNVRELKTKVGGLVASRFGGDYKAAFEHYDANKDGGVDKSELGHLLSDAGVGNGMTRGTWASRIIEKIDSDRDGKIEWSEFQSVFSASA